MWWEGGCDVIFNITEGGLELIFFVLEGVLSKFLLDNSSFSAPLLIIIAQSLTMIHRFMTSHPVAKSREAPRWTPDATWFLRYFNPQANGIM